MRQNALGGLSIECCFLVGSRVPTGRRDGGCIMNDGGGGGGGTMNGGGGIK